MSILNAIEWNVSPEIFQWGSIQVRYYGLLFASGFMISFYIVQKFYRDAKFDPAEVDKLTIYTIIGAILGARFGHVFFYEFNYYIANPGEILKVWHGGLASHGGVIGILISTFIFSKKHKRPYLWILDRIAIPAALTGSLIRLGNLMNSEIYGTTTDLPWGFIFVQNGETMAMHPTQLYESLAYLIVFIAMGWAYKYKKAGLYSGRLLGLFLIGIFTFRFFIEFIKHNQVGMEEHMALNLGQYLSIPAILIGIALLIYSSKNKISAPNN